MLNFQGPFPIDMVPLFHGHVEFSGRFFTFKTSGGEDQLSTDVTVSKHWMCLVYWTTYCGSCWKKLLGRRSKVEMTVVLGTKKRCVVGHFEGGKRLLREGCSVGA